MRILAPQAPAAPEADFEAQALRAIGAIEVRPPAAFLWFGRREEAGARERLVEAIARRLADDFFASAGVPRAQRAAPAAAPGHAASFVRALSQANGGRGAWQAGWRIAGCRDHEDDGVLVVRPDGLALVAAPEHVREAAAGNEVLQPKELRGLSPGCYVALGDAPLPADIGLAGVYWHVAAAGAPTLVARVTYALNGAGLPFVLELLADPVRYPRADAAVLQLARSDVPAALKLLRPMLRALGPHLADGVPPFTKALSRGIAVAEQPAGAARFGEHVCRLLAEALVVASERDPHAAAGERLAAVRERFAAAGVSLGAPDRQPGTSDVDARP